MAIFTPPVLKLREGAAVSRLCSWAVRLLLCVFAIHAAASQSEVVEYQIKAAFLYKFGAYIEWPEQTFPQTSSPVIIGVMGSDAVADELAQMSSGRNINGRPVNVKKLNYGDPIKGLHILFIARTDQSRMAATLTAARGLPLLVVTETDHTSMPVGVINFVIDGEKVRFDVALRSAEVNNIKLSARLLTVARKVIGAPS